MWKGIKTKLGAFALAAAILVSGGAVGAVTLAKVATPESPVVDGNLIADGGFETYTNEAAGAWKVEKQGQKVEVELENTYTGEQALVIDSKSATYSEIYQALDVDKNTDYRMTFQLFNAAFVRANQNLFFGLASETYGDTGVDYSQQHRWKETSNFAGDGTTAGYTFISGVFNSGNHDKARAFIRVSQMRVILDDVTIEKVEPVSPKGEANLLQQAGFEGSEAEVKEAWTLATETEFAELFGVDDVRSAPVYQPGVLIQDKQIEGFRCAYLGAPAGVENTSLTISQTVTVEKNSRYAFVVNLSKWGTVNECAISIFGAEEKALSETKISDTAISAARYTPVMVLANSGENETLKVQIKLKLALSVGSWGVGLNIDDTAFYKVADVPAGKTNLIKNPSFSEGVVGDKTCANWTQQNGNFFEKGEYNGGKGYFGEWAEGDGLTQTGISLEANKFYKLVVRARTYIPTAGVSALENPVTLKVSSGATVLGQTSANTEGNTRIFQAYTLAFKSTAAFTDASVFIGFTGALTNTSLWRGGIDVGYVSLYEVAESELYPPAEEEKDALISLDSSVVIDQAASKITLSSAMKVSDLLDKVQAGEGYTASVVKADNSAAASADSLTKDMKVLVKDSTGKTVKTYTVSVPEAGGGDKKSGCGSVSNVGGTFLGTAAAILALTGAGLIIFKKKDRA